jgi:dienelactone hydrolase
MNVPWAVAPPTGPQAFGAYTHWPDNLDWSVQLLRLIGYSYLDLGGSEFSEIYSVARHLEVGDEEAWLAGFSALARRLDSEAHTAREGAHLVTARALWRRACIYFRLAATFHSMRGIQDLDVIDESRRCFRAAMALDERCHVEAVEIPYQHDRLPAYLVSPRGSTQPRPTAIVLGGIDAFSEEMYFKLGEALIDRGYTVLLPDGPGQGETRRRRIPARADYEVAVAALVDFLEHRGEVDPKRIGLIGSSMGGYFAARGAAFESRLAAVVVWGAYYGIAPAGQPAGGDSRRRLAQVMVMFATDSTEELAVKVRRFNLEGVATKIDRPVLILHAQNDIQVPFAHAQRLYEDIPHPDKQLIAYPPDMPGCTHCQLDAPSVAQADICDWLEGRLQ